MRERTLELLALVDEIHLREAARVLDAPPSETLKAVAALEKSGVVVSRLIGRTRFVSLNRRWFAAVELRRLLERMTEANPKRHAT